MQNLRLLLTTVFLYIAFKNASYSQGIHSHLESVKDTNTLNHFLEKGRFYGHARSYFSATLNQKNLTDYYAYGLGAGIGYQTPMILKHFQLGLSGFFMFNIASSDLSKPDERTGQSNRYEIGLFDIERPHDHEDLDRLEELFIKYHFGKKSSLTLGRQIPQTPFINPQDGRMRPTLVEGAVLKLNELKNFSIHAEYTWQISPRSTVRWMDIGESMGVYPVGIGVDGKPSQYKNHTSSKFIGILGVSYQLKHWNIQLWNQYTENIHHTIFSKIEWKSPSHLGKNWMIGTQVIRQFTVGNGGNPDELLTYNLPHNRATVASIRLGQQSAKFEWFLNATRITSEGRYLMPREWGREPFYTFLPRERTEGMGDLTATTVNTFFKPHQKLKIEASGGYFQLADVKNAALNKYGMPSYSQINLGLTYQFDNYLKGLNVLLLMVRKDKIGETYNNDRYVFNKVNMTHINFIVNYHY